MAAPSSAASGGSAFIVSASAARETSSDRNERCGGRLLDSGWCRCFLSRRTEGFVKHLNTHKTFVVSVVASVPTCAVFYVCVSSVSSSPSFVLILEHRVRVQNLKRGVNTVYIVFVGGCKTGRVWSFKTCCIFSSSS